MTNTPKTILVIEDEDLLANILSNRLTTLGHKVIRGKDGEEGQKLAEENKVDLIMTDVLLPILDGVTMLKKIREGGNDTPAIILTNLEQVQDTEGAIVSPRDLVIKKTYYSLENLIETIQKRLDITD